jgi:hypothetical protein
MGWHGARSQEPCRVGAVGAPASTPEDLPASGSKRMPAVAQRAGAPGIPCNLDRGPSGPERIHNMWGL